MFRLTSGPVDFRARQRDRLKKYFGKHFEFYELCAEKLRVVPHDTAAMKAFSEWVCAELKLRTNGGRDAALSKFLQKIPTSIILEAADNALLMQVVRWNELTLFETDRFYAGVDPDDRISCIVDPVSTTSWLIETTFGYRQLISDLLIAFWETCCGRFVGDPYAHLQRNFDRAARGEAIALYGLAAWDDVAQTEPIAAFAKMFAFSHEIGHVNAHKAGKKFFCERDEEVYADEFAATIYLAAALMLLPPFSTLVANGRIRNARERREFVSNNPVLRPFFVNAEGSFDSVQAGIREVMPRSGLFESESELKRFSLLNLLMWVSPILIFRAIEQLEHRSASPDPRVATHPCAADRLEAYWSRTPNETMRKALDQHFGPALRRLFHASV